MRLNTPPTDAAADESREFAADSGLWAVMALALWLNAVLMAALILLPGRGWGAWLALAAWAAGLGAAAWLLGRARAIVHDAIFSLSYRDRAFLALGIVVLFLMPAVAKGPRVLSDGFLWAAPALILAAVRPTLARLALAWTLAGAWFAAWRVEGVWLAVLGAFGVSWLAAMGTVHFAFTGEPHGLSGGWALRRAVRNALFTSIPALAAAAAAWWLWPRLGWGGAAGGGLPRKIVESGGLQPRPTARQIEPMVLADLAWRGILVLILLLLTFALLLYIRRLFLRRQRVNAIGDLLPGQVGRLSYEVKPPSPRHKPLGGLRGKIVTLWARWAAAMGGEGYERKPGETAAQFAHRLESERPEAAPPTPMTELLEKAHYGPAEPTREDLEKMRRLVEDALSEQSLRRQMPMTEAETAEDSKPDGLVQ